MSKIIEGVELFAVGVWHHVRFTADDLQGIAKAFAHFTSVLRVPLKLGHNDEQQVTDGMPALGWVSNVRLSEDNKKLLGDFVDVPDIVYNAISKKLYNSLSIELDLEVDYKGDRFPYLLTGVALLGADLPAVNTLSDLSSYIGKKEDERPKAHSRFSFSNRQEEVKQTPKPKEVKTMTDNVELEKMKLEFAAMKAEKEKLQADFAKREKELEDQKRKELFSAKKKAFEDTLEAHVKTRAITPAMRDKFSAKIKDNDIGSIELVSELVEAVADEVPEDKSKAQFSKQGGSDKSGVAPDKELVKKAKALQAEFGDLSFSAAAGRVLAANEELARDYVNLTREI